jgi:hypothetical protein
VRQVQVLTAEMDGFSAELLSRVRWSLYDGHQAPAGGSSHAIR